MAITYRVRAGNQPATPDAVCAPGRCALYVAILWLISMQAYYALVDMLGLVRGYDGAPFLFSAYYLAWTGFALWLFRPVLAGAFDRKTVLQEARVMVPLLAVFAGFVVYVLPLLPAVSRLRAPADPPEFMFASAWYYLPKSAEILFQQTLAAVLILSAARAGYRLRRIALGMALAFGSVHLLLALDGFTALYIARFTLSAIAFGALLPVLYLRLARGFRWAYGLHWGFYALDATLTHFILAAPPWALP